VAKSGLNKSSDPLLQKIGKYVVIDEIGSGGMGVVYRAQDVALNRTVAIKMLKRAGLADGKSAMMEQFFARELRATASLQHRNIAQRAKQKCHVLPMCVLLFATTYAWSATRDAGKR
jgi:serine/threonine protein kinase